jgi:hypothetical protein
MSVLDDESDIRNGPAEIVVFWTFAAVGILGFLFIPPISEVTAWHFLRKSGTNRSTILASWALFLANTIFLCFYCTLFMAFGLQSQATDVQLYNSTLYLIPFGVGAGAAILGTAGGTLVLLFVLNAMLVEFWWILTGPCYNFICFTGIFGLGLMVTIILEGCFVIVCPVLRLGQITMFYTSVIVCFGVVFAPATAIMGLEYWYKHNGTTLILLVSVFGAAALRPMAMRLLGKFSCCKKWSGYVDRVKEAMGVKTETG